MAGASLLSTEQADADAVQPVNLELVTLTETSAVITWYTGEPGTDDGLGRMRPAPADGEVVYGTHPSRLNQTVAEDDDTACHYVELTGLESLDLDTPAELEEARFIWHAVMRVHGAQTSPASFIRKAN